MPERSQDLDLSSVLMAIAQDPVLRHDLDQILGDYCHQCRNRLNSLKLSIYLVKRQSLGKIPEAWRSLESDYQTLEAQFERIQTICRPICLSLVTIGLNLLFEDRHESWSKIMAECGRELEIHQPDGRSVARFDVHHLGTALDAVVAWRAEQGSRVAKTCLRWWVEAGQAYVKWIEPLAPDQTDKPISFRPETAWTLPTLTRVVAEHGGDLKIDDRNGWVLTLSWPSSPN